MSNEEEVLICHHCQLRLVKQPVSFSYMNYNVSKDILRCRECGIVYIPESVVNGEMAKLEILLEEK